MLARRPRPGSPTAGSAAPLLRSGDRALLDAGFTSVDYVELRDAETLAPLAAVADRPARLLAAAHMGQVRLIDNVPVPATSPVSRAAVSQRKQRP